ERDRAALSLADCGRKACVPALLRVINDQRTKDHRSTLLYACSEYNCAEWVVDLVRIWITSDNAYDFHVLVVFDSMSEIPVELLDEALELLRVMRTSPFDAGSTRVASWTTWRCAPTRIDRSIDTEAHDFTMGQIHRRLEVAVPAIVHFVPDLGEIHFQETVIAWFMAG
ncbi:MAG TPA: hypothetical protein PL070_01125, partial [Flavobacteriales bacterium]|nr:hypothetical protein [Flavobacteriales bacterium]